MTPSDIPEVWRNLLSQIQQQDPTAILAGGAMRDAYCGKTHKDLDFFTTDVVTLKPDMVKIITDDVPFGLRTRLSKSTARDAYRGAKWINYVEDFVWHGLDINLITCEKYPSVIEFLESFDFGICQIAYDGKQVICTNAFHWDFKHKLFTMRHGKRYEKSKARFERIGQRYQGWQMVMSDVAVVEATKVKFGIKDHVEEVLT